MDARGRGRSAARWDRPGGGRGEGGGSARGGVPLMGMEWRRISGSMLGEGGANAAPDTEAGAESFSARRPTEVFDSWSWYASYLAAANLERHAYLVASFASTRRNRAPDRCLSSLQMGRGRRGMAMRIRNLRHPCTIPNLHRSAPPEVPRGASSAVGHVPCAVPPPRPPPL